MVGSFVLVKRRGGRLARGNLDRTLESDRAFMEEWCYVWSNYS